MKLNWNLIYRLVKILLIAHCLLFVFPTQNFSEPIHRLDSEAARAKYEQLLEGLSENIVNGTPAEGEHLLSQLFYLVQNYYGTQDSAYANTLYWRAYYANNLGDKVTSIRAIVDTIDAIERSTTFLGYHGEDEVIKSDFDTWRAESRVAALNFFAQLRSTQGLPEQALEIYKRLNRIVPSEDSYPKATILSNLARVQHSLGYNRESLDNYEEAASHMLNVFESTDLIFIALQTNIAAVLLDLGKPGDAKKVYEQAYSDALLAVGSDHIISMISLLGLSHIQNMEGMYSKAEENLLRIVPLVWSDLTNASGLAQEAVIELAWARSGLGREEAALSTLEEGFNSFVSQIQLLPYDIDERAGGMLEQVETSIAEAYIHSLYRAKNRGFLRADAAFDRSFLAAQWIGQTKPALAVAQMSRRSEASSSEASILIRQRQDAFRKIAEMHTILQNAAAAGVFNTEAVDSARKQIATAQADISIINDALTKLEPGRSLSESSVVSLSQLQIGDPSVDPILGRDEVLVVLLPLKGVGGFSEGIAVWFVSGTEYDFRIVDVSLAEVVQKVSGVRCGLHWSQWEEIEAQDQCFRALELSKLPSSIYPPFERTYSHSLYNMLFDSILGDTKEERVIVIPYGVLSLLPFNVLVTSHDYSKDRFNEDFSDVKWMGLEHEMTLLPDVSSLVHLWTSSQKNSEHLRYIGYGDPELSGEGRQCYGSSSMGDCNLLSASSSFFHSPGIGGEMDISLAVDASRLAEQVSSLCPLPETRWEVECVSKSIGTQGSVVRLGIESTEADLKSRTDLSTFDVLHFATHGLLAGQVPNPENAALEPALVFTPPGMPVGSDDGLLFSSEILDLQLDADLVVLSACNTASGGDLDAEPLNGLAHAFIYAGTRSLLVSHWPVNSQVAAYLTVNMFLEREEHGQDAWSKFLRRSMRKLVEDELTTTSSHPSIWAPFFIVGNISPRKY